MTAYLQPADYDAFGLECDDDRQVEAASRLIDGYLGRPEGLLWVADADGEPAWMAGLTPSRSYTIPVALAAGATNITIPKAQFGLQTAGATALLDRAGSPEVVTVAAGTGGALTINAIEYSHLAGATLEFGLALSEQVTNRNGTLGLRRYPVAKVLSIFGQQNYPSYGPPAYSNGSGWANFPVVQTDYNTDSGVLSLTGGTVSPAFTSARVQYVAGWSYATLPNAIKQAVARLVSNQLGLASEGFAPGIKVLKSGDGMIERFGGAGGQEIIIDSTIAALLAPYKIYRL